MSVGLAQPRDIFPISGIRIGAVDAGIRKSSGEDLVVFEISSDSTIAGVFTRNRARAAPVELALDHLHQKNASQRGKLRAMVVNSGNANAGVGRSGLEDCDRVCNMVAEAIGISADSVIPFSTGVIGERLPLEKFEQSIDLCVQALSEDNWLAAARAIMTTDTIPKAVSRVVDMGEYGPVAITGIAKGSGMIQPDMATMLAFIATDADIPADSLASELELAVEESFNRITVDGDTSTNDSCMLIATGTSGVEIDSDGPQQLMDEFRSVLMEVTVELAQAIIRDGEGATKFVTIEVAGANSRMDSLEIARTVANSPLVKTALHACDPNWGRIYGAVGRARVENLDMSSMRLCIGDVEVMKDGAVSPGYSERAAFGIMKNEEFTIFIDLGLSKDKYNTATVWTCDLSAEYVRINADYRT